MAANDSLTVSVNKLVVGLVVLTVSSTAGLLYNLNQNITKLTYEVANITSKSTETKEDLNNIIVRLNSLEARDNSNNVRITVLEKTLDDINRNLAEINKKLK